MKITFHHCRRFVIATLVMICIISLSWWGLWSIAAGQYRGVIDGWIEQGRAAGYQITYTDRQLFGFPRHVVLRFNNLHWQNTDGIDFHADNIDIGALPWQWQKFEAKFKGYAEIDAPLDVANTALIIAGNEGIAHVVLDKDGYWKFSQLKLNTAKFGRSPDYLFTAEELKVSAEYPDTPPQNHKDTGFTVSGDARNVTLPTAIPSPFGQKMARLGVDARVMDVMPDFRLRPSVEVWNKDSGVVEFDRLHMEWGNLIMSSKGTLGFDDDLQPEGAFAGSVENQEVVLQELMAGGFIAPRQEGMLSSAMRLFAKPSKFNDTKGIEIPITIQLGGLFLGPVKIFAFPEIVWPTELPKVTNTTPASAAATSPIGTAAPALIGTTAPAMIGTAAPAAAPIGTSAPAANPSPASPPDDEQP